MKAVGALILAAALFVALWLAAGRRDDQLLIDEPDQVAVIPAGGEWCDMRPVFRQRPRAKHLEPANLFEYDQRAIS